jgi:hypothetical protein
MSGPLTHCKARLEWAREHISQLRALNAEFQATKPYQVIGEYDSSSGWFTVQLKASPVPNRVGLLIGDILHNLRSTLDHLLWQLTIANGHVPDTFPLPKKSKWADLQFPMVDSPQAYANVANRRLWGISQQSRDRIERFQPYNMVPNPGDVSVLWMLRELSNVDKHRLPNVAVGWLHWCRIVGPPLMAGQASLAELRSPNWPGPFGEDTEIIGMRFDPPLRFMPELGKGFQVELETDIVFHEGNGIGQGMPVIETLDVMESLVHAIVYGSGKHVGSNPWHTHVKGVMTTK